MTSVENYVLYAFAVFVFIILMLLARNIMSSRKAKSVERAVKEKLETEEHIAKEKRAEDSRVTNMKYATNEKVARIKQANKPGYKVDDDMQVFYCNGVTTYRKRKKL